MHTEAMPAGLWYLPDFLTGDEEDELLTALAPLDWDGRGVLEKRGKIVRRREVDFLQNYDRRKRGTTPGLPLPTFLDQVRVRVAAAASLTPTDIEQIITALYRPGAGIDWHTDAIKAFGETICSVSLGSPCTMQFRRNKAEGVSYRMTLAPRSLLIMQGPARWEYQHHIPSVKQTRYSITLRTLSEGTQNPGGAAA
jgi:alkylated DNA repair dioxygenase AlkB